MFTLLTYLKFYWSATNAHGIHSPFIYDFVTNGLYIPKLHKNKSIDTFLKVVNYFNPESITLQGASEDFKKSIVTARPKTQLCQSSSFIYWDFKSDKTRKELTKCLSPGKGHTFYLGNIRHNKEAFVTWQNLICSEEHFVSIDLYYAGILFFRPTQAKQHFRIRI